MAKDSAHGPSYSPDVALAIRPSLPEVFHARLTREDKAWVTTPRINRRLAPVPGLSRRTRRRLAEKRRMRPR
jgi:hypothetical protein